MKRRGSETTAADPPVKKRSESQVVLDLGSTVVAEPPQSM